MHLGIIGTNFISDMLVEAAKRVDGISPCAVYSRRDDTGRTFANKYDGMTVFTDLQSFLDSDIDAVYVASPSFLHKEHTLCALRSGKHVLCEKMMALRYSDGIEMVKTARESGCILLEAMRPIHDPAFSVIRDNLDKIGRIRRVHFEYCQYSSRYDRFKQGTVLNAFDPTIGNSALADIGIYPLQMCIGLFGAPNTVCASSLLLSNGFEGMGEIALGYTDMHSSITYSKITEGTRPSVIEGEDGTITVSKLNEVATVTLLRRGEDPVILKNSGQGQSNMHYELAHFRDMTLGKMQNDAYLDISLNSLAVVDEVYRQTGIDSEFLL